MPGGDVYLNPDGIAELIIITKDNPIKSRFYCSLVAHHSASRMSKLFADLHLLVIKKNSLCFTHAQLH